jgi:hypothetical protein
VQGLKEMEGLSRVARVGFKQTLLHRQDRQPIGQMVDLAQVLTPEQLKQVDPRVVAFYKNPEAFDVHTGIDIPKDLFSHLLLGTIGPIASSLGDIPDRQPGFENFPLEQELYRDAQGRAHWDRYVVVDGKRRDLFLARFEVVGKQVRETFTVDGVDIPLYFNVEPYQGGVRLVLDHTKSTKAAALSNIVFTTVPTAEGLSTTGRYTCRQKASLVKGTLSFKIAPKKASAAS